MAKTPKLKNSTRPGINSRLARKAAASGLTKDYSLPSLHTSTFLAPKPSNAVIKKRSQKPLKRKQRLRLEAGRQKAEDVKGKTEIKVLGSVGRGKRRNGRRKPWEEVDEDIAKESIAESGGRKSSKKSWRTDEGQGGRQEETEQLVGDEGDMETDVVETGLDNQNTANGEGQIS